MEETNNEKLTETGDDVRSGEKAEKVCHIALITAALLLFILTGSSKALIMVLLAVVWLIIIKYKHSKRFYETKSTHIKRSLIFWMIAVLANLFSAPLFVGTNGVWRYPIIKRYVHGAYHAVRMPEWFPDKLPQSTKSSRISYLPSVMQGSGYFSVSFECDVTEAEKWAEFGKENAKYIIPFCDYQKVHRSSSEGYNTIPFLPSGYETAPEYAVYTDQNYDDRDLSIVYNSSFWYGDEDGAVIYVKETSLDPEHPLTEAMIVNKEKGMVQLYSE